jgi:hypothetical protein
VTERLQVREIDDDEGRRLVLWRRSSYVQIGHRTEPGLLTPPPVPALAAEQRKRLVRRKLEAVRKALTALLSWNGSGSRDDRADAGAGGAVCAA